MVCAGYSALIQCFFLMSSPLASFVFCEKKRFMAVVKILKILGWIMLGNYITYFVLDHIDPSLSGPTEVSMEQSNLTLIGVSSFFSTLFFKKKFA